MPLAIDDVVCCTATMIQIRGEKEKRVIVDVSRKLMLIFKLDR